MKYFRVKQAASFSGKFYRLRGWKQQRLLKDVEQEVMKHV